MQCLMIDQGHTWSRFAWPKITETIPANLLKGLRVVQETSLCALDNFYSSMLRSYALSIIFIMSGLME